MAVPAFSCALGAVLRAGGLRDTRPRPPGRRQAAQGPAGRFSRSRVAYPPGERDRLSPWGKISHEGGRAVAGQGVETFLPWGAGGARLSRALRMCAAYARTPLRLSVSAALRFISPLFRCVSSCFAACFGHGNAAVNAGAHCGSAWARGSPRCRGPSRYGPKRDLAFSGAGGVALLQPQYTAGRAVATRLRGNFYIVHGENLISPPSPNPAHRQSIFPFPSVKATVCPGRLVPGYLVVNHPPSGRCFGWLHGGNKIHTRNSHSSFPKNLFRTAHSLPALPAWRSCCVPGMS